MPLESNFKILVDTCVWLDLAKDYKQQSILHALEELVRGGSISLILPRTIIDEFARNKAKVIEESGRSLSSTLKRTKEAVENLANPRRKRSMLRQLNDLDQILPTLGEAAVGTISRIEELFARSNIIEISDAVKLRSAQRAIDKRAPFHRQRNGIDDAILIEVYADEVLTKARAGTRFAFVSHNTKDFSHPNGNQKLPHPDFASLFSRKRSLYFISLGETLRRVRPEQFAELMVEQEWIEEPRRISDIIDAIDEHVTKVWYNRHKVLQQKIERGKVKIVEKEAFPVIDHERRPIQRDVWEGACKSAAKTESRFGLENLGPWADFEWGMLNGKLSALRWVLGDEWDVLDT